MANETLIDAEQLAARLGHDNVVVADCRFSLANPNLGRTQYQQGHVPGAHYFDLARDLSAPVEQHGGRHPLPDMETLSALLRRSGVDADSLVVTYDDSRFGFAARFWWLLRYLGHANVRVLNGGYKGWVSAGLPTSTEPPTKRQGSFVPRINQAMLATRADVLALDETDNREASLIDSRELKRFLGEEEPIDRVAGRIPGARCFPWQGYTSAEGAAISEAANLERWADLDRSRSTILYCGSGVTACVNALSLEAAGIPNVRLYAGSFSDWCSYSDSPIAVGPD
jgi:thiosulfate/3-mercaptopyruvate sulfurtransferase